MGYAYKYLDIIKLDKNIKAIPYPKRKNIPLIIGEDYFISYRPNEALPCKLVAINAESITVELSIKPRSKKGYIDDLGKISHEWKIKRYLHRDEIGRTPEEAMQHEVTY